MGWRDDADRLAVEAGARAARRRLLLLDQPVEVGLGVEDAELDREGGEFLDGRDI